MYVDCQLVNMLLSNKTHSTDKNPKLKILNYLDLIAPLTTLIRFLLKFLRCPSQVTKITIKPTIILIKRLLN